MKRLGLWSRMQLALCQLTDTATLFPGSELECYLTVLVTTFGDCIRLGGLSMALIKAVQESQAHLRGK